MASFDKAIPTILKHEGGYVNDPLDPGGETNFGISKRTFPDVDIKTLREDQAISIYRELYWLPGIYDAIVDQDTATKVFDLAVNMGHRAAHRLLQKALRKFKVHHLLDIKIDGVFGPKTLQAINEGGEPEEILDELRIQAAVYYANLMVKKPGLVRFAYNWMRRAQS
ncbi:hypothetical protein LCGC14_1809290 [marine sediment metagenome]|uniref:Uncharacterized protein n=1 Tax=marine sediment metagenome TaxID=412755 RepID=A0A0F9JLW7_9ZZZZ